MTRKVEAILGCPLVRFNETKLLTWACKLLQSLSEALKFHALELSSPGILLYWYWLLLFADAFAMACIRRFYRKIKFQYKVLI